MTETGAPTPYAARVDSVRAAMREQKLDALLVMGPANRRYLTGFTALDGQIGESSGQVLVTPDAAYLMTSPLYTEQAKAEAAGVEHVELRDGKYAPLVAERLKAWGVGRLGFERDYTVYGFYEDLREHLGEGRELVSTKRIVEGLRIAKSPEEIERLRAVAGVVDEAFGAVVGNLPPGITERKLARAIDEEIERLGAESAPFDTIVASGICSARPHHEPGDTPLAPGAPVVIDVGARLDGYCADMTRSFCPARADDRYRELWAVVLAAHERAAGALRPGLSGVDADNVARGVLRDAGYEREFNHSLGHGVGLDVHEPPSLSKVSEDTLAAGMVVTVEPGVYLPDYGGVRIEDTVVVTADGCEPLNRAEKAVSY